MFHTDSHYQAVLMDETSELFELASWMMLLQQTERAVCGGRYFLLLPATPWLG